jgi:hypothetical protein
MSRRVTACAAVAACALPAVLPSSALAAERFEGRTEQNRKVTVVVGDDDRVRRVVVSWRTTNCRRGEFLRDQTQFFRFGESTADSFRSAGSYATRSGRVRIRMRVSIRGTRSADPADPAAATWSGRFAARAVVRRRGKVIDRCRLGAKDWTATLTPQ